VAHRTPTQLANQRRVERVIRTAAPFLDLVLFAGHHVSRVTGRHELEPEPARHSAGSGSIRTPIGAGPLKPRA
jgi:hypothetical protein